jgi:hypothetical protein
MRRRHWVFIIVGEECNILRKNFLRMSHFARQDKLDQLIAEAVSEQERRDLISLRNGLLLYKALRKERVREMDICFDGFTHFKKHYQHFCRDSDFRPLIEKPLIAETYPNEIFPGRLYLGDWHHAADKQVIETLNITHILNISDTCENYLEKSHRKCFSTITFRILFI